jgi:DNA polymerase III alpha subunit (gram-positive type)
MNLTQYSDYSLVLQGEETKKYIQNLKDIGGKWNKNLKNGSGWIFNKNKEADILNFLNNLKSEENNVSEQNNESKQNLNNLLELKSKINYLESENKYLQTKYNNTNKICKYCSMVDTINCCF